MVDRKVENPGIRKLSDLWELFIPKLVLTHLWVIPIRGASPGPSVWHTFMKWFCDPGFFFSAASFQHPVIVGPLYSGLGCKREPKCRASHCTFLCPVLNPQWSVHAFHLEMLQGCLGEFPYWQWGRALRFVPTCLLKCVSKCTCLWVLPVESVLFKKAKFVFNVCLSSVSSLNWYSL